MQDESIANNPYYFTGAFSTVVVVPAAYNFVINFMSNHSQEEPSGYLDGYNFKSFFGVTGEPGSFVWERGQEKVPENWVSQKAAFSCEDSLTKTSTVVLHLTSIPPLMSSRMLESHTPPTPTP